MSKYTTETFSKLVDNMTDGEYTVIGEYTGAKKSVDVKHNTCRKYIWRLS